MVQVASVMTVWNHLQPAYAANMWNEALNKRLGTKVMFLYNHIHEMLLFFEIKTVDNTLFKQLIE